MKHRGHEKHKHRRNPSEGQRSEDEGEDERTTRSTIRQTSSSSDGETMWVFDTPEQRLQCREEEKLQRQRLFRVLNGYDIKRVSPSSAPMPALSRQRSDTEFGVSPAEVSPTSQSLQKDSKVTPLLPPRGKVTERRRDRNLMVVENENEDLEVNLDGLASVRETTTTMVMTKVASI